MRVKLVGIMLLIASLGACGHPERFSELPLSGQSYDDSTETVAPGEAPRSNLAADRVDAAAGANQPRKRK